MRVLKLLELFSNVNYTELDTDYINNFIINSNNKTLNKKLELLMKEYSKDNLKYVNSYIKSLLISKDKSKSNMMFKKIIELSQFKGSEIYNLLYSNKKLELTKNELQLLKDSYTLNINNEITELSKILEVK